MNASIEMPRYVSHKTVWALKIAAIAPLPNPDPTGNSVASSYGATITPAEKGYAPFDVDAAYCNKHSPKVGGYFVQYSDGYKSFSPAQAFEEGYTLTGANKPQSLESAIVAAGADVAPRVTPTDIEAAIASEHYFTAADGDAQAMQNAAFVNGALDGKQMRPVPGPLGLLTFCVLVLNNGFTVTGESACASPENFNAEIGKRIARDNAKQKLWPLLGYQLREQLYQRTQPAQAPTDSTLLPHQQRVVTEKAELDDKLRKLQAFISSPTFDGLSNDEKSMLADQLIHMDNYSEVLGQRIAAFS